MIPPTENAEFVWRIEAVLDVYQTEYNPQVPVICLDEGTDETVRDKDLIRYPFVLYKAKV